jgi:2-polyprenyl-6-hydroxyphenyl methylase / 3-demethylubiquinone-9 3-methyltransferase
LPVDNELYDRLSTSWWDETGFLHLLKALNPARFGYMRRMLVEELRIDPQGKRVLDVGCGGGILSEEFARMGCEVVGIDLSEASIEVAREHALQEGLTIEYHAGKAESLPFPTASFDVVYCCDVLEHVEDVGATIAETARVLKPGGVYFFDTINRTLASWLVTIKIFQDWPATKFMPPDLHDWKKFIKPRELTEILAANGFELRDLRGLSATVNPLQAFAILRARKRNELTYVEAMERLFIAESTNLDLSYIGYGVKPAAPR